LLVRGPRRDALLAHQHPLGLLDHLPGGQRTLKLGRQLARSAVTSRTAAGRRPGLVLFVGFVCAGSFP
jgi:hypothetical protein